MRKSYFFFLSLFAFLLAVNLFAQEILWEKEIDDGEYFYRIIKPNIIQDKNQNYLISVQDYRTTVPILVKLSSNGELEFVNNYLEKYSLTNKNIYLNDDGNYYLVNSAYENPSIVFAGYFKRVPQTILVDIYGNIISKSYNTGLFDSLVFKNEFFEDPYGNNIFLKNKKNEILTPYIRNRTENNKVINHLIINKYNFDCSLQWKKGYDSLNFGNESKSLMLLTSYYSDEGNYLFLLSNTKKSLKEFHLLNINDEGNVLSLKKYISPDSTILIRNFLFCSDGSVIFDGYKSNNINSRYLYKLDKNSDSLVLKKVITNGFPHNVTCLHELSDGDFLEAGYVVLDTGVYDVDDNTCSLFLRKLDKDFNVVWYSTWKTFFGRLNINDIIETSDGNILLAGYSDSGSTFNNKLYVAKIKDNTTGNIDEGKTRSMALDLRIFPQPAGKEINVEINLVQAANVSVDIFDSNSNRVMNGISKYVEDGLHTISMNTEELASGVYYCRLRAGDSEVTRKVVIVR